jgi:hypothetical protein
MKYNKGALVGLHGLQVEETVERLARCFLQGQRGALGSRG